MWCVLGMFLELSSMALQLSLLAYSCKRDCTHCLVIELSALVRLVIWARECVPPCHLVATSSFNFAGSARWIPCLCAQLRIGQLEGECT